MGNEGVEKIMTKFETIVTRRECNICKSYNIIWSDNEDVNHLCKKCKK